MPVKKYTGAEIDSKCRGMIGYREKSKLETKIMTKTSRNFRCDVCGKFFPDDEVTHGTRTLCIDCDAKTPGACDEIVGTFEPTTFNPHAP